MSKQTNTRPSWAKNAAKAVSYSAQEIMQNRAPFVTNTAVNAVETVKDMRDWLKRNNPFKSTSGAKEPLMRQIVTNAKKTINAGMEDLKSGDLTFSNMKREAEAALGENDEFGFDFDMGDDDDGFDWNNLDSISSSGSDSSEEGSGSSEASFSGKDFNAGMREYSRVVTGTNLAAISEATSQITRTTYKSMNAATDKIIAANLVNFSKISQQISETKGVITTLDKNVATLVEASNDRNKFYSQAQIYMEHTEQTLNDIKAIVAGVHEHLTSEKKSEFANPFHDGAKFLENGFSMGGYMKHVMDNTIVGTFGGMILKSVFDAFKIESPEWLKDAQGLPLSSLLFSNVSEKIFPALKHVEKLDDVLKNGAQTFFEKLDAGDYGGILNLAGMMGFGVSRETKGKFRSGNYNKGATVWDGKSERALQEVIPDHLSSIEKNVEIIAKHILKGKYNEDDVYNERRIYNYDTGSFSNRNVMRAEAQKSLNQAAESALYDSYRQIGEYLKEGKEGELSTKKWMDAFLAKFMGNEDDMPTRKDFRHFENIMKRRGDGVTDEQIAYLWQDLVRKRQDSIKGVGNVRRSASNRSNYMYNLGNEINTMAPQFDFALIPKGDKDAMRDLATRGMDDEERAKYDRQEQAKEAGLDFIDNTIGKLKDTELFKFIKDYTETGGDIGRKIESAIGKATKVIVDTIYQTGRPKKKGEPAPLTQEQVDALPGHLTGVPVVTEPEVCIVDTGEAIQTKEQRQYTENIMQSAATLQNYANSAKHALRNRNVGLTLSGDTKKLFGKFKRRDAITQAETKNIQEVTEPAVARAKTQEELQQAQMNEVTDNVRTLTALAVSNSEQANTKDTQNKAKKIFSFLFGEKGEDGFYEGTDISGVANKAIDAKNYLLNILTGKGYTKSNGEVVGDSEDNLKSMAINAVDSGAELALGGKDSEKYKKYQQGKMKLLGNNKGAGTAENPVQDAAQAAANNIEQAGNDAANAVFGGTNEQQVQDTITDATTETTKSANSDKLRKALLGAGANVGAKLIFGSSAGLLPSLFMPGGIIGSAIVGAGLSFLSRNDTFLDFMYGKEEDGERIGGVISKDLQERYKGMSKKFLGAGAIGALAGKMFPSIVGGLLGPVGKYFIGTGPIGGAALGVGAMLLSKTEAFQTAMYGEDGESGIKGMFKETGDKFKEFFVTNKKKIIAGTAGPLIGGALGRMFPVLGSMAPIPMTIAGAALGAAVGIFSTTDKFKDLMLGTNQGLNDDGTIKRDGNGLIGQLSRMIATKVVRPFASFSKTLSERFIEWFRYDIKEQLKIIFSPVTLEIKTKLNGIGDILKKPFIGLAKAISGVGSFAGSLLSTSLKKSLELAGGLVSAPLKLLSAARVAVSMKQKDRAAAQDDFKTEYFGKHQGYLTKQKEKNKQILDQKIQNAQVNGAGKFKTTMLRLGGSAMIAKNNAQAWLAGHMPTLFSSDLYNQARTDFANNRGLQNDAIFMAGVNAKEHKKKLAEMRANDKLRRKSDKLVAKWGKRDNWNDKLDLSDEEVALRNQELRDIYGKKYGKQFKDLTSDELKQFAKSTDGKDPMEMLIANEEKKKAQEEATAKLQEDSQQATIDVASSLNDPESGFFKNLKNALKASISETIEERQKKWEQEYLEKNGIHKSEDGKIQDGATPAESAKPANDNPAGLTQEQVDNLPHYADGIPKGEAVPNAKNIEFNESKQESATALKRFTEMIQNGGVAKKKESSSGLEGNDIQDGATTDPEPKGDAVTSDDTQGEAKPVLVSVSDKSLTDLNESIHGFKLEDDDDESSLFGKKGIIKTILKTVGVGAAVAGGIALIKHLPEVTKWIKDTAVPWLKENVPKMIDFVSKTLWPILKNIGKAVGSVLTFLVDPFAKTRNNNLGTEEKEGYSIASDWSNNAGLNYQQMERDLLLSNTNPDDNKSMNSEAMRALLGDNWDTYLPGGENEGYYMNGQDLAKLTAIYAGNKFLLDKVHDSGDSSAKLDMEEFKENLKTESSKKWLENFYTEAVERYRGSIDSDGDGQPNTDIEVSDSLGTYSSEMLTGLPDNVLQDVLNYVNGDRAGNRYLPNVGNGIGYGHFMQNDPRWGGRRYAQIRNGGYTTMANGGCGPTALANVAAQSGINVTPDRIARMATFNGYTADGGSNARLFSEGAGKLGLRSAAIGKGGIKSALARGSKVILAGRGAGNGIYTNAGHIISARGLDSRGNAIVDDPMRKKSISVPISRLGRGLTNAWSIGRGPDDETTSEYIDTTKTNNIADYMQSKATNKKIADDKAYDTVATKAYERSVANAKDHRYTYNGTDFGVYFQRNPLWDHSPLGDDGDTIGDSGCVISAMGTALSNMTDLDFNPLVYTDKFGAYWSNKLGYNLNSFMSTAAQKFPSLTAHLVEQPYYNLNDPNLQSALTNGYPIVLYKASSGKTNVFKLYQGNHAEIYKPDAGGKTGKIYDPGSSQAVNQAKDFTTEQVFSPSNQADRAYFYTGSLPSLKEKKDAALWLDDTNRSTIDIIGMSSDNITNGVSNYNNNSTTPATSSSNDGSFLSRLGEVLGDLATIAGNILGSIFGSNSSVYSNSSGSNYTSGSSSYVPGSGLESAANAITFAKSIESYENAPDWAKTAVGIDGGAHSMPSSKKMSPSQLRSLLTQVLGFISVSEAGGDYTSVVPNDAGHVALGIGGFNGINAAEILRRIKNSGQITDTQLASDLDKAIAIASRDSGATSEEGAFIKDVLTRCGEYNKIAQDTYLTQLAMSYMNYPVQAFDDGEISDDRSVVMLSQFGGFGPDYLRRMLKNDPYKSLFSGKTMNSDDLTNTTMVMNKYYSEKVGTFSDGHRNRFKKVYEGLGGDQLTSLGFGAGVADSLNNTSYDIMDTPVAINKDDSCIEEGVNQVTSRQDIVIQLLTKIANAVNRPVYQNTASTSSDNIGSGLRNDMKLKDAGLNTKSQIPLYQKERKNDDLLRSIHNRIARSPRGV